MRKLLSDDSDRVMGLEKERKEGRQKELYISIYRSEQVGADQE